MAHGGAVMSKKELAKAFVKKYYGSAVVAGLDGKCSGACDHHAAPKCSGCSGACNHHA